MNRNHKKVNIFKCKNCIFITYTDYKLHKHVNVIHDKVKPNVFPVEKRERRNHAKRNSNRLKKYNTNSLQLTKKLNNQILFV